jgi:hypothetical protein
MITVEDYQRAERDLTLADWRRGWRIHAAVYAVVNTGLTVLNVLLVVAGDAGFLWFPFPLVGWGIGLAMHYLHGVRWAEREVRARQARIEERAGRRPGG